MGWRQGRETTRVSEGGHVRIFFLWDPVKTTGCCSALDRGRCRGGRQMVRIVAHVGFFL